MPPSINPFRTSGVEFDPFGDMPVFPPLHGLFFACMKLQWREKLYSGCSIIKNIESAIFPGFTTQKFPISFRCRRSCVCLRLWKVMATNYFNTDQVLEMVLADGSDLEDEESVEEVLAISRVKWFGKLFCSFTRRKIFWRFGSTFAAMWQVFAASGGGRSSKFGVYLV